MENGTDFLKSYPGRQVDFVVAVMGNTTSAPTIPTDGTFTAAAAGLFPAAWNSVDRTTAGAPTHTSTGIITVTYKHLLKNVIPYAAVVLSDGASPTAALKAVVTKIVPATRVITVNIYTPSGTLTDPGTSDLVVILCRGRDAA